MIQRAETAAPTHNFLFDSDTEKTQLVVTVTCYLDDADRFPGEVEAGVEQEG